ncbi:MAG: hypothetical protein ABIK09_05875 [Pseudomonadota bacterium]
MKYAYEQHVYSAGRRGLETIAVSAGVDPQLLAEAERLSVYILPGPVYYENATPKPVRYMFRAFAGRILLGRTINFDKALEGRPGKFLSHTLVFDELSLDDIEWNPVPLLEALERTGTFLSELPGPEGVSPGVILKSEIRFRDWGVTTPPAEALRVVLQPLVDRVTQPRPLLCTGNTQEILSFIGWCFDHLPLTLRRACSFDTQAYRSPLGYRIVGFPDDPRYQAGGQVACRLAVSTGRIYDVTPGEHPPSVVEAFLAEHATPGLAEPVQRLHRVLAAFEGRAGMDLGMEWAAAPHEVRSVVFRSRRKEILSMIVERRDEAMLRSVLSELDADDVRGLIEDETMRRFLVDEGGERVRGHLVVLAAEEPVREELLGIALESADLWRTFVQETLGELRPPLLAAARMMRRTLHGALVRVALEEVVGRLRGPDEWPPRRLEKPLQELLSTLPDSKEPSTEVLRDLCLFWLTGDTLFWKNLRDGNKEGPSEDILALVLHEILVGLEERYQPDLFLNDLYTLGRSFPERVVFVEGLIERLEGSGRRSKARADLLGSFHRFYRWLPLEERTPRIEAAAERLLGKRKDPGRSGAISKFFGRDREGR